MGILDLRVGGGWQYERCSFAWAEGCVPYSLLQAPPVQGPGARAGRRTSWRCEGISWVWAPTHPPGLLPMQLSSSEACPCTPARTWALSGKAGQQQAGQGPPVL